LDAANRFSSYGPDDCLNESRFIVAAALRAAADQLVPMGDYTSGEVMLIAMNVRVKLLAIAAELEAAQ
ncbi:MAG: hypothetical protein RLZZ515_444, partial [Cyanobacteriota bacterium]